MSLKKVTYVDKITIISADNMNAIQDNIILNETKLNSLDTDLKTLTNNHELVSQQVETNKTNIETNTTDIETLQEQVSEQITELSNTSTLASSAQNSAEEALNQISNLNKVTVSTATPADPKIGDIWYNPEDQNSLDIDSVPTEESQNLITSGGVAEALNGKIEIIKLWENASPTSEFAAQTIALDLSGYDMLVISYGGYLSSENALSRGKTEFFDLKANMTSFSMNYGYAGYLVSRLFNVSSNEITFYEGGKFDTYTTTDYSNNGLNRFIIPLIIYGIKGVQ